MGVYQDVLIDMTESEDSGLLAEDIDIKNAEADLKLTANRPFLFMVKMDHELLAIGRITVTTNRIFSKSNNPIFLYKRIQFGVNLANQIGKNT